MPSAFNDQKIVFAVQFRDRGKHLVFYLVAGKFSNKESLGMSILADTVDYGELQVWTDFYALWEWKRMG